MSRKAMRRATFAITLLSLGAPGTVWATAEPGPESVIGSPLPLGELPPQAMTTGSCAMFLWERSTRRRILMAMARQATAKVIYGGKAATLAQTGAEGEAIMGFSPHLRYAAEGFAIGVDIAIDANDSGGAIIRDGTLTFTASDGAAVVAPVAGIIGCK